MTTASGALSHIKKAFEYIERLAESDRGIYSSTKRTIAEMMELCEDIIEIGNDLVDDESRQRTYSRKRDVRNDNSDISKRLDRLEQMVTQLCAKDDDNAVDEKPADRQVKKLKNMRGRSKSKKDASDKNTEEFQRKDLQRRTISHVGDCLADMSKNIQDFPENYSPEVRDLGVLIHRWYQIRILDLDRNKCSFRYHVETLPIYIQAIVSDYVDSSYKREEWLQQFDSWLYSVSMNDESCCNYPLPYTTCKVFKDLKDQTEVVSLKTDEVWKELHKAGLSILVMLNQKAGSSRCFDNRTV